MSNRDDNRRRGRPIWTALIFGPAIWCAGCATTPAPEPEVSTEDLAALTQRVEDVERTNARLTVRVEESERQHVLLQDRVESNRIALQRRGYLSDDRGRYVRRDDDDDERGDRDRERPEPTPESSYRQGGQYQADPSMEQRMERRGVTRIPLSNGQAGVAEEDDEESANDSASVEAAPDSGAADDGEELVLTNEILEQRYGTQPRSQERSDERDSRASRESSAQERVTDERLATSSELDGQRQQSESERDRGRDDDASDDDASPELSSDEKTELYQDSLATYRAGDYAEALEGFERFLNADPRQDYVDNALYWIGECQYGLGRYEEAIGYFERITDDMPSAGKVPDAMLKMSMAYDQINQPEEAVSLLRDLIADHATTNPGRLGQERLEEHPLAQNE